MAADALPVPSAVPPFRLIGAASPIPGFGCCRPQSRLWALASLLGRPVLGLLVWRIVERLTNGAGRTAGILFTLKLA